MPLHDQWPNVTPLTGRGPHREEWESDPEVYKKYWLGSLSKDRLSQPKSVQYDQNVLVKVGDLIASKRTPYTNLGQYTRDSCLKNYVDQAVLLDDPMMKSAAEEMLNHAESDHRAFMRKRNKEFIENQTEDLRVAKSVSEIKAVLELCERESRYMKGVHLEELNRIIEECKVRLR